MMSRQPENSFSRAAGFIGREVKVRIDRALGTRHPDHSFIYSLNYGYVPGEIAPDGEELDAYVLGVFDPVEEFTGDCIAVIHRRNDNDDKLVIAPKGRNFSDEQIQALTEFQEQFFISEIIRA